MSFALWSRPLACALILSSLLAAATPEAQLRHRFSKKTGAITLPAGTIEISREIVFPSDAYDLDISGVTTAEAHHQSGFHIPRRA